MTKDEEWVLTEKYDGIDTIPEFNIDRARLAKGEPVAYVIGWQPFLGLKIFLDSKPLIPRTETEWWTEKMIEALPDTPFSFLDLCAGSGAIGCAVLKHRPHANVYFGEIEKAHEATIHKNISENKLDTARASVRIGDLFAPFGTMQFDFIAINPPYIPEERVLSKSVADFEPAGALFAGHDGLDLIRRIANELPEHLTPGGQAWIECDSAHSEEAKRLCEASGRSAQIRTDQFGVPRVLVIKA